MKTGAQIVPIDQVNKKQVMSIPVDSIRRYEDQPRTEFNPDALWALAESIREHGLQQPITVVVLKNEKHYYELKDGERRWRAHQLIGWKFIDAIVDMETKPGEQHLQSLIANFNREDHTPMEISLALAKEKARGVSVKSLATACGKSDAWVYQHLLLQQLHPKLQKRMSEKDKNKKLTLQPASELARIEDRDKQLLIYSQMRKISGAAERIRFIQESSGREIKPREKRPSRDAKNLQNFAHRMESGVEKFASMPQSEFKAMVSRLSNVEINVLINQLKAGANSLQELADFVGNFK